MFMTGLDQRMAVEQRTQTDNLAGRIRLTKTSSGATFMQFHDANVTSITGNMNQVGSIALVDTSGQQWLIGLKNIQRLLVHDFREGNIVLEVTIYERKIPRRISRKIFLA
jgi:hypothetical protein